MGTLGPRWAAPGSLMAVLGTFVVDVKTSLVSLSDQLGSANFRFHLGSSLGKACDSSLFTKVPWEEAVLVSLLLSLLG